MDSSLAVAAALVAFAALVLAFVVLGLFFAHSGPRRAGLVASALPLASTLPVVAGSYAAFRLIRAFSAMSATGTAGEVHPELMGAWMVLRIGWGGTAAVALLALVFGLLPTRERAGVPACSTRRALVLLAIPVCALALAAGLLHPMRSSLRVANAVVQPGADDAAGKAAAERALEAEGLGSARGSAGIAAISNHIAVGMTLGSVGGLVALVVLLGLAATGALLAARVRVPALFVAAGSGLALLAALLGAAIALGVGDPLRLG